MSEQIIQRVVDATNDKRVVLFNSQLARTISIGSNWSYLRIGLRFALQGTATFGPIRMFIGVTAGSTNVWASQYCQHALGALYGLASATAAYNATAGGTYAFGSSPITYSKVSQTEQQHVNAYILATTVYVAADAPNRNCFQSLDIVKLGGNAYTLVMNGGTATSGASIANKSYDLIRAAMLPTSYIDSAAVAGITAGVPRNTNVAVNESLNGAFDSVCVYWRHPSVGMEISDLLVARLA